MYLPGQRIPRLARVNPRPETEYVGQGRTVMATDTAGEIKGDPRHGLFVHQTRLLSRYRYLVEDKAPMRVAISNVEQHSWLGYYIAEPPGIEWSKDTGSGKLQPSSEETIELRVSRFVGRGVHEDLDLRNFTLRPARVRFEIEIDA